MELPVEISSALSTQSSGEIGNIIKGLSLRGGYYDLYLTGRIVYRVGDYTKTINGYIVSCHDSLKAASDRFFTLTQKRNYPNGVVKERDIHFKKSNIRGICYSNGTYIPATQLSDYF